VHFAMDFLTQQNRRLFSRHPSDEEALHAAGKDVIVIGGGDTGSDCVGTSVRHGAASVTQLEIMPKPPEREEKDLTWPNWPMKMRTSTSHEEGCERDWSVSTKRLTGSDGKVEKIQLVRVEWETRPAGGFMMVEVPDSEFELKADLVLLAMGFVNPVHEGLLEQLGVALDDRGNVQAELQGDKAYHTSVDKVFAAGDVRRGQSLVVWAIHEGRSCARAVDEYLMDESDLPT